MRQLALLAAAALALSGCGLRPLYGGGPDGAVRSTLSAVEVAPIKGQSGWLVANALRTGSTIMTPLPAIGWK